MVDNSKREEVEGDPERGDAILKRMLKTPPKQHKDMKLRKNDETERRKTNKKAGK